MDAESPRLRLSILGVVIVSMFGALFARLWYLQVMSAGQYQDVAVQNTTKVVYEEPPRGRILDRNGKVIVDNRTSLVVTANPHELDSSGKRDEILFRIAQELTRSGRPTKVRSLERRLHDPQYNPLQPVPIAVDVPEDLYVFLSERAEEFPGIAVNREAVRSYPYGAAAAHVVGYVGRINEEELRARQGTPDHPKENPKPYQPDSNIGKEGVERVYEDELRGTPGVRRIEVDSLGRVVRTVEHRPPRPGNDVQLSIDIDIQVSLEKALAEQLDLVRGGYTSDGKIAAAPAGSAVMLEPGTGRVLALASYPTYDPSEFVNGISTERYQELTRNPAENPFVNRAISGQYAPGSTFKLVTAFGAMSSGMINGNTSYVDGGVYQLMKCSGNCTRQNPNRQGHGTVNVSSALTVSSDVFFYWIGDRFFWEADRWGQGLQSAARTFGFGAKTGIDLPGESAGNVPDADWKRRTWESLPPDQKAKGDPTWYPGDSVNLAIGQGDMLATPLQLANAYAMFVDQGVHHKPTVVMRILQPASEAADPAHPAVIREIEPEVTYTADMPAAIHEPIRQGLLGVASSGGVFTGTAYNAFRGFDTKAFPVLSKTGTAQVNNKADTALYVACAPDPEYKYCLSIVLEEAGFGGNVAAPVARRVFEPLAGQQTEEGSKPSVVRSSD
ncbi:MAG: penicillin-binding protein 2 [Acidimicrobiales bacterium]|nr:penicillin-binding protein 2 [Acidimicrobiales bacterium]